MGRPGEARPGEAGACYIVRTGPIRGHGGWGGRWHLPRAVAGRMEQAQYFPSMTGGGHSRIGNGSSAKKRINQNLDGLPLESISA